jgi:hypothetical protein
MDVDGHIPVPTRTNFDSSEQLLADNHPVDNGTNDDGTSNANGHKAINTTRDINATELPPTNNTPVYVDNGANASRRVDQYYQGALVTSYVNDGGHVESTYKNSATKQHSANDPPVNNATAANGDDGCNGDVPVVPPDNC